MNSWRVFHDRSLPMRCCRGFVLPVLEYCPVVWCSAANTHLKLLDRAVSGALFLTGGVFECDIAHRGSVAVLCILYTIRCNQMHPLNGLLSGPYMPVRIAWGCSGCTSVYLCASPLKNLSVPQDFMPVSVSLWNDLADPVFDGVGLAGFKSMANAFSLVQVALTLL